MGGFEPKIPFEIQIRKIIFENYNDTEARFTNDEIFEKIKKNGDIDSSWTIDNLENYFQDICDKGLVRNIAQNFTTQWFKLFNNVEVLNCKSCKMEIYLGKSEKRICPNMKCQVNL